MRQAQKAMGSQKLGSITKTGGKSASVFGPIDFAIEGMQGYLDAKEYITQGMDTTEAIGRSATNTVGRIGFSLAITSGLPATCAFVGGFFGPVGAAVGGLIGHLGAWAIDYAYSDNVGDWVEENVYTRTPEENKYLVFE